MEAAYLKELQVYVSPYPKVRIGNPTNDGGYAVCELPGSYDGVLSGGVGNDCSFEEGLLRKYPDLPFCAAFDGTCVAPLTSAPIRFIRKNLAAQTTETTTNLHEELAAAHDLFVKLDIEGHEFRIVPTWGQHMTHIKQFVLELHTPADFGKHRECYEGLHDIPYEMVYGLLNFINQTHTLVHLHPNNGCGTHAFGGRNIPNVFECTFVRNEFVPHKTLNIDTIPSSIDVRNHSWYPEITLGGWPFVAPI